ncbi:MAG: helix-hairpin-helix domain-containing protein [Bacteroidetes bacterium]|nr:helix-hairpin-helix domain-containing protein [Bacteroidota bacterium]
MKTHAQQLFTFTDSERNGTIVLLILIAMVTVIISLQEKFTSLPKENFSDFDKFLATVQLKNNSDSLFDEKKNHWSEKENETSNGPSVSEEAGQHSVFHSKELFNFNPNGLSADDWVRLGLSPAQARSIKNYETKGGKFFSKDDVRKMFVISAERYNELEPFIVLPEKSERNDSTKGYVDYKKENAAAKLAKSKFPSVIELNTADTSDLMSVNGIGPAFAKRILAYRERLGGYHSINQLTEVFGIDADKFAAIKSFVKADSTYIRKININTAEVSDFRKLPYISPNVANAIVSYRKAHGIFKSILEIKGCVLINVDLYQRIAPYLSI